MRSELYSCRDPASSVSVSGNSSTLDSIRTFILFCDCGGAKSWQINTFFQLPFYSPLRIKLKHNSVANCSLLLFFQSLIMSIDSLKKLNIKIYNLTFCRKIFLNKKVKIFSFRLSLCSWMVCRNSLLLQLTCCSSFW